MPELQLDADILAKGSKGRVVVITGGVTGIGAALVSLFCDQGAHVCFSDWNKAGGTKLAESLKFRSASAQGSVTFSQVDVRDYHAQLAVFETAYKKHHLIDHAIYTAGVVDPRGWMTTSTLNLETVKKDPQPLADVLDINLKGCLYFSLIAVAYMKEGHTQNDDSSFEARKSFTLISSANGFMEAPGLYAYASSKAGIIGLLRSFKPISVKNFGIRVNVVCPTATDTPMVAAAMDYVRQVGAPLSTPGGCGKIIQQLALDPKHHGEVVVILNDRGWDIEAGLDRTRHVWLDDEPATLLEETQEKMAAHQDWSEAHT